MKSILLVLILVLNQTAWADNQNEKIDITKREFNSAIVSACQIGIATAVQHLKLNLKGDKKELKRRFEDAWSECEKINN